MYLQQRRGDDACTETHTTFLFIVINACEIAQVDNVRLIYIDRESQMATNGADSARKSASACRQ